MNVRRIGIDKIQIGPRRREELGDLEALAASIQQHGLIHPIVVDQDGTLVAGERRLKACQLLGWAEIDVRFYEDLTEEERWAIELEENLHRKDLTEYERSKTLVALAETARELAQQEQTGTVTASEEKEVPRQASLPEEPEAFRSTVERKSRDRGRPKEPGSYRDVAQHTGIPVATMKRAEAHVAAVEKYPELQGMTQAEALAIGQRLDQLPVNEREQQRIALRHAASPVLNESPQPAASTPARMSRRRRPKDPDRPWVKAMYSLWIFRQNTRDRPSVLARARRWPRETIQHYLEGIRQVKTELIEWERTLEEMLLIPTARRHPNDGPDPRSTGPTEPQGELPDRGLNAPEGELVSTNNGVEREELTEGIIPADQSKQPMSLANRGTDHVPHETTSTAISPHGADAMAPLSTDTMEAPQVRKDAHGSVADEDREPASSASADASCSEGVEIRRLAVLARVKTLQAEVLSLRAIARELNAAQVPTLHGEGQWDHRKVARLLEADER